MICGISNEYLNYSALILAAIKDHTEIVEELISKENLDINIHSIFFYKDIHNIHKLFYLNNIYIFIFLWNLTRIFNSTALMYGISNNSIKMVQILLTRKDIDFQIQNILIIKTFTIFKA